MNFKNIIKKYLFLTFLSGAAVCSSCNKEENDLERKLGSEVRIYNYLLNKAENSFKRFISDGYFDGPEQKNILCDLRIMDKCRKEVARLSEFTNVPSLQTPDILKIIYPPLAKNQRGFDLGTPELEKILNQNGLNVKVEKCISTKEIQIPIYALIGALIIRGIYVGMKNDKGKGMLGQTKSYLRNN